MTHMLLSRSLCRLLLTLLLLLPAITALSTGITLVGGTPARPRYFLGPPSLAAATRFRYQTEKPNKVFDLLQDDNLDIYLSKTFNDSSASTSKAVSLYRHTRGRPPSAVVKCQSEIVSPKQRKIAYSKGLLGIASRLLAKVFTNGGEKFYGNTSNWKWEREMYNCRSFCDCAWRIVLDRKNIYPLARPIYSPFILYEHFQLWFKASKETDQFHGWTVEEGRLLIGLIENLIVAITLSVSKKAAKSLPSGSWEITQCRSWIRKICRKLDTFPSSLILKGVELDKTSIAIKCGGFADIYRGVYGEKQVALKIPRTDGTIKRTKRMHEEIVHEALFWRYLDHKHIVPFIGIVQDTSIPRIALVTPWMKNGTISQYLENNTDVNRLSLLAQSALGLKYLHDQKPPLIHGDIKAANILIDDDGFARLTDFGLITLPEIEGIQITQCLEGGSIRWMSPELIMGNTTRTQQSDVYAFGMTIIEVYTGLSPFTGRYNNDAQIIFAVCNGVRPARPNNASTQSNLPDEIWNLAEQCWRPDPVNRPTIQQIEKKLSFLCT